MEDLQHQSNREMRQFRRKSYTEAIDFSVVMPEFRERSASGLKGRIVDLSDGGIGIQTDHPLEPGAMLCFTSGDSEKSGVIKWAIKMDDSRHRAGIAFRSDDTSGTQYPVELADARGEVREDCEQYARVLEIKTGAYCEALEALASSCSAPGTDPEKILRGVKILNDDMMGACAEFEKAAAGDSDLIQSRRKTFHERTDRILCRSTLVRHARTWPRGYQGDYKMLESLYKNTPLSEGIGYYLDRYGLSLPLGEAVRNRIVRLEEIVRREISNRNAASVLNIACGSCRELMGLAPDIARTNAQVTCIDMDADALAFSMERLSFTEASENITFRKYNAARMFDDELNMAAFGKADIIYSAGLFDYLPSEFLAKVLGALYRLLSENGTLIAAFKDAARYRHQDFHWITDWTGFLQRTEKEFLSILD
ncbi:MAG: methyltransferase domain-containing protein, partial [Nitrospirae bacterium]|nr:methyltransferase domain-containing protein [Nitrospirota bacterium]